MNTQEVKGTLAKLLATENLTVEHRRVSTACFDVDKRLLILPIWKTASNTIYDLLVGHEVGHALYTPNKDFGDAPKDFVNVLEDARIERMMKVTYPGLRKSFFEGYRELWNDDFFGVKGEDPAELALIDRINLYFKGNSSIPFSDEERVWVNRTENTKSFQDVTDLATELYEYCSEKQDEKELDQMPELNLDDLKGSDRQEEIELEDNDDGELEEEQGEDQVNAPSSGLTEKELDELEDRMYDDHIGGETGGTPDETESVTDKAFTQALETLIDDNAKEWVYLTVPNPKVEDYTIPYSEIQENLFNHFYHPEREDTMKWFENVEYGVDHYNTFKTVSYTHLTLPTKA